MFELIERVALARFSRLTGRSAGHQTQNTQAVESASNRRLPTANDSYG